MDHVQIRYVPEVGETEIVTSEVLHGREIHVVNNSDTGNLTELMYFICTKVDAQCLFSKFYALGVFPEKFHSSLFPDRKSFDKSFRLLNLAV